MKSVTTLLLLFLVSYLSLATEVRLKTGKFFRGKVVETTDHYLSLETDGSIINIAKSLIAQIDGKEFTGELPGPTQQEQETKQQPPAKPAKEKDTKAFRTTGLSPVGHGSSHRFILGKTTRIRLSSGASFRGRILTVGEQFIVLEIENSRMNIAKTLIAEVDGKKIASPESLPPVSPQVATDTPQQSLPHSGSGPNSTSGAATHKTVESGAAPLDPKDQSIKVPVDETEGDFDWQEESSDEFVMVYDEPIPPTPVPTKTSPDETTSRHIEPTKTPFAGASTENVSKAETPNEVDTTATDVPAGVRIASPSAISDSQESGSEMRAGKSEGQVLASRETPKSPRVSTPSVPKGVEQTSRSRITITDVSPGSTPAESRVEIEPDELQRIIDKLRSRLPENRMRAILMLRTAGPAASPAVSHLVPLLSDTTAFSPLSKEGKESFDFVGPTSISEQAALTLAAVGDYAAEPLMDALHNPLWVVRAQAIFVLGELRYHGAVRDIVSALSDTSLVVSDIAVEALVKIGDPSAVYGALRGRDVEVKKYAIEVLTRLKDPSAVKALSKALRDRDSYVREKAAYALGEIGDRVAAEALVEALDDNISFVRHNAVEALAKLRDPSVIPYLRGVLKDPSDYVRSKALETVRTLASYAYGKHATDTKVLLADLRNQDPAVRERASSLLWLLTGQEFGTDIKEWETWLEKNGGTLAPPPAQRQN